MSTAPPRVSIGLPVYNGSKYMARAIESILGQDFPSLELIVSDNCSQDDTVAIAQSYADQDSRVSLHRQAVNVGASSNHNLIVELARGEYFRWAGHDDVMAPQYLASCVEALDARPDAVLAYPLTRSIDEFGETIRDYEPPAWRGTTPSGRMEDILLSGDPYATHCFPANGLIRLSALRRTGLLRPFQSSDRALLVELALLGAFAMVPEYLFLRRFHVGTSRRANVTPDEIARWFDTRRDERFPMPRTTLFRSFTSAVRRASIPVGEKLACYRVLARYLGRDKTWRVIIGEHRIRARERLSGIPGRT